MKRYKIVYFNEESMYPTTCYCIGDADLNATLVDLVNEGNFIDMISEKDAKDTIGSYYGVTSIVKLLKELNILNKNDANQEKAYRAWGL